MINFFKRFFMASIAAMAFFSCDNDSMDTLAFVGDSEVARWDLPYYFPTRIVENHGRSGAGIDYIESLAGKFKDKTVVVVIGTNDLYKLIDGGLDLYALRYVEAIKGLGADRTFLYSIFPRNFASDMVDFNDIIRQLNKVVKTLVTEDVSFTYIPVFDDLYSSETKSINHQYSYDGLHLNDFGYELISKKLTQLL